MRRTFIARLAALAAGSLMGCSATLVSAAIATIDAVNIQDNTVAEDFPDNSSGACDSIFAGNTDNSFARRALMRFDVGAQIPPGSTINSVTLTLTVTRGGNNVDSTFNLHPINAAWTEGTEGCGVRGGGQGEPSTGGVTWNTMPGTGASSGSALVDRRHPVVWNSRSYGLRRPGLAGQPGEQQRLDGDRRRGQPHDHPPLRQQRGRQPAAAGGGFHADRRHRGLL